MRSVFISDLHLDSERPRITELFLRFLDHGARDADRLFILGDLFEYWVGDDHVTDLSASVAGGLARLASRGCEIAFLHGNRDFLLGEGYASQCGMKLLPDPFRLELGGRPALLSHGDTLCTDDLQYQAVRRRLRDPDWQSEFLSRPLAERLAFAREARAESAAHVSGADASIMDVNPAAVRQCVREHGVDWLIHGHTHRPALHRDTVDGKAFRRVVLGDWYEQGSVLVQEGDRLDLMELPVGA